MDNDIRLGLSFNAVCFDFRSTNVGSSVIGTRRGPFKYYVIKEVGGWGQKMAIFDDLQYCKSSKRWVGLKKSKT